MIQLRSSNSDKGFTVVELMIAMAFISLLLLAIIMTVMQVGAIYSKGITMKSVNQAGRIVVADMKRTIGESGVTITYKPHERGNDAGNPIYDAGRLCTGVYSYIWNIGTFIGSDPSDPNFQVNKYTGTDDDRKKPLRLTKVKDSGGRYCQGDGTDGIPRSDAVELLSESELAVQDFHIERVTDNLASGTALYSVRITISNAETEAIDTVDNTCRPPSEEPTLQNFCAVNEFAFTARAGSGGGQ